jgi:ribosomal protein S3AE
MVVIKKHSFDVKLELLNMDIQLMTTGPDALHGKTIKLDITKFLKGKGAEAKFIIKKNEALEGKIYSFSIYPSHIRRMISHNISIVEDSFVCKIKDADIRFKPFLITRKRVHRAVRKALRDAAKEFIEKNVATKTRDKLFQSVLASILQRMMAIKLKKVYPLAVCELRIVEVVKPKELLKA